MPRLAMLVEAVAFAFLGGAAASLAADHPPLDFNRDIRPILSGACFACHGPDDASREADLRLDTHAGATADLGGYAALVPGDPEASALIERIASDDEGLRMPPADKGPRLTTAEIDTLRRWIATGAPYARHWSFEPPQKAPLPEYQGAESLRQPIDRFIVARLRPEGLAPSPAAPREVYARRVALALTGLPPSWDEVAEFVADEQPDAYARYVDAQLAKPAYGERWAHVWLDLARYADSAGYADDPLRTIWAYRDYVIRSFNANKPFDEFTIEQLAGDLLPHPRDEQLTATAFHRNTMTNNEGGTNDEQFRNEAIVDRVNTTMSVWMGVTMACAQCHNHKYDPLSQAEYFQLFDFFNQTADADLRDESPTLPLWSEEQQARQAELVAEQAALRKQLQADAPELDREFADWLAAVRRPADWSRLVPAAASADAGSLALAAESAVRLQGERPAQATYQLRFAVDEPLKLAALRLQVLPSQQHNFVLSRARLQWTPREAQSLPARYVRVELPGEGRFLHVAEVQVFSGGANVAPRGAASQSSTDYEAPASRAIDGTTHGDFFAGSVTHTAQQTDPWLEIDLGAEQPLDAVEIWNRTDGDATTAARLAGVRIRLLDAERREVAQYTPPAVPQPSARWAVDGSRTLPLATAVADYEQPGFPAADVTLGGGAIDPQRGWAVGGAVGAAHALTLPLPQPLELGPGELTLELAQRSVHTHHVLTDFAVELTAAPQASDRAALPSELRELVDASALSEEQQARLRAHFRAVAPALAPLRTKLAELEREQAAMQPATSVPILRELPADRRRTTRVQLRGNYQSLAEAVTAGVPGVFAPLPDGARRDRLALARWLVAPENPLTARVVVNRYWEELFGVGIVATSEEFGSQGELPSHPELLDWLATDLMEHGWDLQRLLKQIVLSATYRQSSVCDAALRQRDPDNRLLARGPRFRIAAEMVRDQTLAATGLLSHKQFGPPVRPPQPQLGLSAAFGSGTDWETSAGEDRYRRSVYTQWRRSNPYPSLATFDAPNREVCTIRRSRTNTPLQALVTLNDPAYIEAAQALARRMVEHDDVSSRLADGVRAVLVREPTEAELTRLTALYRAAEEHFRTRLDDARRFAADPLGPLPEGRPAEQVAALVVVANTLLNLDEFLMPL